MWRFKIDKCYPRHPRCFSFYKYYHCLHNISGTILGTNSTRRVRLIRKVDKFYLLFDLLLDLHCQWVSTNNPRQEETEEHWRVSTQNLTASWLSLLAVWNCVAVTSWDWRGRYQPPLPSSVHRCTSLTVQSTLVLYCFISWRDILVLYSHQAMVSFRLIYIIHLLFIYQIHETNVKSAV